MTNVESCSVCGRTMLKGERTRIYLTPESERRGVCELCRSRAEAAGWIREELAGERTAPPQHQPRRRGSLSGFLRGRSAPPPAPEDHADTDRESEEQPRERRSPDPAAPGARVGRADSGEAAGSRLERAVARFNRSPHSRTVTGLIKSLGPPSVSVGSGAGSPGEVRITIAWELSWYQWGVDLQAEERAVHEIDKGHEIAQLDRPAREWNAHVAEDGSVRLGVAPMARTEPAGAES